MTLERGLHVREVPVSALSVWERNPRRLSREGWERLLASLRMDPDLMWARPLIATEDGTVIAGNMRLRAVIELGWSTVPCVVVDGERATRIAIKDNVQVGEWDEELLAELLHEMEAELDPAVALAAATSMTDRELARMMDREPPLDEYRLGEPQWSERTCPSCGHVYREL